MEHFRQLQPLANDYAGNWPGAAPSRRLRRVAPPWRLEIQQTKEEASAPASEKEASAGED